MDRCGCSLMLEEAILKWTRIVERERRVRETKKVYPRPDGVKPSWLFTDENSNSNNSDEKVLK